METDGGLPNKELTERCTDSCPRAFSKYTSIGGMGGAIGSCFDCYVFLGGSLPYLILFIIIIIIIIIISYNLGHEDASGEA